MPSKETRLQRGHRRGIALRDRLITELRDARLALGISQQQLAEALGCSQSLICRRESRRLGDIGVVALSEAAALLGLELSVGLHQVGQPIRDKGHQALIRRFRLLLAAAWSIHSEVQFPAAGDLRWWDLLLRLGEHLVGVEVETRVRDFQALVRRIHARQSSGGVDHVILLLSDSRHNRALAGELRAALGSEFTHSPRELLSALRSGRPLPGSGVLLV